MGAGFPGILAPGVLLWGMARSPAELRRHAKAMVAHARAARSDAELARQRAIQCREAAEAARTRAKRLRVLPVPHRTARTTGRLHRHASSRRARPAPPWPV